MIFIFQCSPRMCIFKKHNLLHENETIDYDAVGKHLDKWSENQQNIAEGVEESKKICFGKKNGPPVPQKPFAAPHNVPCQVDRLLICIRSNVIWVSIFEIMLNAISKISESIIPEMIVEAPL